MPWKMQLAAACPAEPFRKSHAVFGEKNLAGGSVENEGSENPHDMHE